MYDNGKAKTKAINDEYLNSAGINELNEIPKAITTTMKNHSFSMNATLNFVKKKNTKIANINAKIIDGSIL